MRMSRPRHQGGTAQRRRRRHDDRRRPSRNEGRRPDGLAFPSVGSRIQPPDGPESLRLRRRRDYPRPRRRRRPGGERRSTPERRAGPEEVDRREKVALCRVNALDTPYFYRDLIEIVEGSGENLDAILIPKVERPGALYAVGTLLTQIELATGLER